MKIVTCRKYRTGGFTLVELSIAMIIIGLLIAGTLKGKQIIENARIVKIIAMEKSIQAGMLVFKDSYGSLPGDISRAESLIPNCSTSNHCLNGNGDGWVGSPQISGKSLSRKFYTDPETVQFWKHMALADIMGGIDPAADPGLPGFGTTHPETPIKGGFEIFREALGIFDYPDGPKGQFLRLSNMGLDSLMVDSMGLAILTPAQAMAIENKMDDGLPTTGNVLVWDYGNYGCDNLSNGDVGIDPTSSVQSCVVFFALQR